MAEVRTSNVVLESEKDLRESPAWKLASRSFETQVSVTQMALSQKLAMLELSRIQSRKVMSRVKPMDGYLEAAKKEVRFVLFMRSVNSTLHRNTESLEEI
jgi:hypothetical protein